jgi:hypothetical protein
MTSRQARARWIRSLLPLAFPVVLIQAVTLLPVSPGSPAEPLALIRLASAADTVAVLTEIRAGRGEIRVKRAGAAEWTAPQPLLTLYAGDQVRVTQDGRAVVTFSGGGARTVTAATSPLTVEAPRGDSASDRLKGLLGGVTQFLLGQQKEPTFQALSVRSGAGDPPRIVSPRGTKVLAGSLAFEWTGPKARPYRFRLTGPDGAAWEQAEVSRSPFDYPASAPPLRPGARYVWTIETAGHPVQQAEFETLGTQDAARVRAALEDLRPAALAGYPPGTVALFRAGFLLQEGLNADARRELLAGIAADPDEATLHQVLAQVYDRMGLGAQAAQEWDEAQFLAR